MEEREHPVPADRSSEKVDEGSVPSDGEGHDLLHSERETQSISPSPRLIKVHVHVHINLLSFHVCVQVHVHEDKAAYHSMLNLSTT